jgi:hypothetical protein
MTSDRLQSIARRLGNSFWCRHWLHFNYPLQEPWLMAVSCLDGDGNPLNVALEGLGFVKVHHGDLIVYTVPRTDERGEPFRSKLT